MELKQYYLFSFVVSSATCLFAALLGKEDRMDVGKDTSRSDGDTSQKSVEFLIVLYGKSDVTGHDTALLVVSGGVSGKLQDFGAEVFENCGEVDRCSGSHSGGIFSLTQVTTDTTDGELQTGSCRCGGGFLFTATSFSFSCGRRKIKQHHEGLEWFEWVIDHGHFTWQPLQLRCRRDG
jgi:hypothetical protein